MTRACLLVAALLLLGVNPGPARAGRATCSNPGLPAGAAASGELLPGRLTLALTAGLLPLSSTELLDEDGQALRYESRLLLAETRLAASYAFTPSLALDAALPYRVVDVGVGYRDPTTGAEVVPQAPPIHARNETLHGLGDASVALHLAGEVAGLGVHARLGTTVPLGSTVDNPYVLGQVGQEHQHVQLGTGTFVPSLAVEVQRPVGDATVAGFGLVLASLYDNDRGYRAGDRYSAGVSASSGLGRKAWTFSLASEVHAETAETWDGQVPLDEGNAGRVDVLAGGTVAWRPAPGWALVADVKVPVYSHVSGPQLDYPIVLGLGVIASVDVKPRPSWRGLDHAVLGAPGTAAPLAPAPGRYTVVDLWASWCAPCRELDERLLALARRHRGALAVRKLDVVDTDSAAWVTYLEPGGFALPHVKLYGPDGALVFERSAPPAELIRQIEAVLDGQGTAQVPR